MSDNLKLWQAVEKTDPKYTKAFSRAGGFSGTAINATYLIRKATEQWGPMGGNWAALVEDEKYVPGAEDTVIHVLRIRFRHPGGEFHSYGQTTFVGKNKNGTFTDEEAPKKSLTDAITKALAMLGFSADVFLGLYDDNKYVNDRKAEFGGTTTSRITPVAGSLESLSTEDQEKARQIANGIVDLWGEGKDLTAYELFYDSKHSNELKLGIWEILQPHSTIRNTLKKMHTATKQPKAA
jgi:hypothetical protein